MNEYSCGGTPKVYRRHVVNIVFPNTEMAALAPYSRNAIDNRLDNPPMHRLLDLF